MYDPDIVIDEGEPTLWQRLVKLFKSSETLVFARFQALVGFLIAVGGSLDWSPLVGLFQGGGFSREQVIGLAITLTVQGIFTEYLRRRRAPNLGEPK